MVEKMCSIHSSPFHSSRYSRHPGENFEQTRKVLILQTHATCGREHFISYRRGWQRYIELEAHFQIQQQGLSASC